MVLILSETNDSTCDKLASWLKYYEVSFLEN